MNLSDPISAVVPSLEGRVLVVLSRAQAPLTGSRVADLVPGSSNPGVRAALGRLVEQGTVLAARSSHAVLYRANREHLAWPAIEAAVRFAAHTLDALRERLVALLVEHLGPDRAARTTVALYGSVARGTSDRRSDVDLVVLTPDDVAADQAEHLLLDITVGVERWTGNACSVYELSTDRLTALVRAADPMVRSWLDDATTISGPDLRELLRAHGA
ncbi:nucleotidyltransferase domain-containing protein [Cellulomonas sp. GbtcB1]|uniref:nucleotidyltransferase domain-containing protein n=1 Tax=Cellulomonas sp. GbtcB1 TaxID=2824746 RepID=UPI001C30CEF0|nr:nucleotidyltransferase domain-containing protein [Cellulomonas sp. GbtcB1]